MITRRAIVRGTAIAITGAVILAGCGDAADEETPAEGTEEDEGMNGEDGHDHDEMEGHDHPADGGPPPEGITEAEDPTYPVGSEVVVNADHMPGMEGAAATVSGAFETTTYSITFTPTDGGEQVTDHRWVVHEELVDPEDAPLAEGTEVVVDADHMSGMEGAEATIDSSTDETVYMIDLSIDGMEMTNHKWVVESELAPVG